MFGVFKMMKKAQTGLVGAVVGIAIAAVVAVICVQIYNSVGNAAISSGALNGTTKTVALNIPVFIFLGLLVSAAMYFAMK